MHVLDYLADPSCEKRPEHSLRAEYRLLCSGTLHHDCIGDFSKSEVARILLDKPLWLFVTNRPFDDYPLELALQLTVQEVTDEVTSKNGSYSQIYHADDEVVRDLAALLSLLCRRLITVVGRTSVRYSGGIHPLLREQLVPVALSSSVRRVFWRPHPVHVVSSLDGHTNRDYNPRPKAIESSRLTRLLMGLATHPHATSLVGSCRLYALALELIHEQPDISYQLLISSVETLANAALRTFQPDDDFKVKHQKAVYEMAISLRLDEEAARKLAIAACRREWWATKKFKQFLNDNVSETIWNEQDELFNQVDQELMPQRSEFEQTLGKIYNARSKATHEGQPFPVSASYTGGPQMSSQAAAALFGEDSPFPPVVWFERVVNSAICGFWERSTPNVTSTKT